MKKIKTFAFLLSVILVSLGAGYVIATWTGPSTTAPNGNPNPPINVSTNPQVKNGRISAREFLDYNDPSYYLKDESGNAKLEGKLSFNSSIKKSDGTMIYDPTATHDNCFDPDNPDTPRTNTGLLNQDLFPY